MNDQNKAMTAALRAMKKSLKEQHGIDVPHSALRASYLQAQGEHPHAFSSKHPETETVTTLRQLIAEAPKFFHPVYDFDGEKLEWLQRAGLVKKPKSQKGNSAPLSNHILYLAEDDLGCLELLSLDPDAEILVPEDWDFKGAFVVGLNAKIPRQSKYGLPQYLAEPNTFFSSNWLGLVLSPFHENHIIDLGDDSGDSCEVEIQMQDAHWQALVTAILDENVPFYENISEWVGLHYKKVFSGESPGQKLQWVERYLETLNEGN